MFLPKVIKALCRKKIGRIVRLNTLLNGMQMAEQINLTIGGVALIPRKRERRAGPILIKLTQEFREILEANFFFNDASLDSISLIFRYGEIENLEPQGFKIDKKRGQLDLAIYSNIYDLQKLSDKELESYCRLALIEVLFAVAANYGLPYEFLDAHRENV